MAFGRVVRLGRGFSHGITIKPVARSRHLVGVQTPGGLVGRRGVVIGLHGCHALTGDDLVARRAGAVAARRGVARSDHAVDGGAAQGIGCCGRRAPGGHAEADDAHQGKIPSEATDHEDLQSRLFVHKPRRRPRLQVTNDVRPQEPRDQVCRRGKVDNVTERDRR